MAQNQPTPERNSWKRELMEVIAKDMPITQLTPDIPTVQQTDAVGFLNFPRFDVYLVQLHRKKPDEWFILAGSKVIVASQVTLMKAINDMLDYKLEGFSNFPGGGTVKRAGAPLVTLFFQEDRPDDAPDDWVRSKGEISFRLMDISEVQTEGKIKISAQFVKTLAEKIYDEFQKPNDKKGFLWQKGKRSYNYYNEDEGYGFKILHDNNDGGEAHAEGIVKKILKIRGHTFDADKVSFSTPKNLSTDRDRRPVNVLGQEIKPPRFRPEVVVRFRYAKLELQIRRKSILLVTRGRIPDLSYLE